MPTGKRVTKKSARKKNGQLRILQTSGSTFATVAPLFVDRLELNVAELSERKMSELIAAAEVLGGHIEIHIRKNDGHPRSIRTS